MPYANREVRLAYLRADAQANKDKRKEYIKQNREQIRRKDRERNVRDKEKRQRQQRERRIKQGWSYSTLPEAEKEKRRAQAAAAYWKDTEKASKRAKDYRLKNLVRLREQVRQYRTINREELRAKERANPEQGRLRGARRAARKRSLPVLFTKQHQEYMLQYWGYACVICGRQQSLFGVVLANEHWIPLASPECPGTVPWNMLPMCHGTQGCNNSKGPRNALIWLQERLGKKKAANIINKIEE